MWLRACAHKNYEAMVPEGGVHCVYFTTYTSLQVAYIIEARPVLHSLSV